MIPLQHGWFIVFSSIIAFTVVCGVAISSFGLFVLPLSTEFGLSRADANTALILVNLGGAGLAPIVGRLADIWSVRSILFASALSFGVGLCLLGISHSLWLDIAILALLVPFAIQGSCFVTMPVLIARWFHRERGRAMTIGLIGLSLGAIAIPPVTGILISLLGWRAALSISGICAAGLLLAIFAFIRPWPDRDEADDGAVRITLTAQRSSRMTIAQLLRIPRLWIIISSAAAAFSVSQGVMVSLVPVATQNGLAIMDGAALLSAFGAGAAIGKLLLAIYADRFSRLTLLATLFAFGALACLIPVFDQSYLALAIMAGGVGISAVMVPVLYALLADIFGSASFGTVQGIALFAMAVASATAIRAAGEIFDQTGSYTTVFQIFIAVDLVAAALIFSFGGDRAKSSRCG